jgi:hypothetical protein
MTSGEYNPDLGWLMHDKYRRDGTPYPETQEGLLEWTRDYGDFANANATGQKLTRSSATCRRSISSRRKRSPEASDSHAAINIRPLKK